MPEPAGSDLPGTRDPDPDCAICPRLSSFRGANRRAFRDWHNAPVPSFGGIEASLLIVGLAPGLKGANRTGRPFTGDHAGELLYRTLIRFGLAEGRFEGEADDGLVLRGCRITNAVRCVPPENKPTPLEVANCRRFLGAEIAALRSLRTILALGAIAHDAVVAVFGLRRRDAPFRHGASHALPGGVILADSYHCSRYNTNTGRLTREMFEAVVAGVHPAHPTVPGADARRSPPGSDPTAGADARSRI
ncbi:MAG: uracil-DNA glycosylase [Rhodospirillales bacterium]